MAELSPRSSLLIGGARTRHGDIVSVSPQGDDWRYIRFRATALPKGSSLNGQTGENEAVVLVIGGTVHITSPDASWKNVGTRKDPFSGPPSGVYLPPASNYEIAAATDAELAICQAPGSTCFPARRIQLAPDSGRFRGEGNTQRRIYDILMEEDAACSLFLTEVVTFQGNWSSYPPHKHDTDDLPRESQLEELYYYRAQPEQGFAFQRVYSKSGDLDQTVTAHDRDVVLVPRGYHVCAAAAGYSIYYLNVLAGPRHVYRMTFDPAHEWIKEGWTW
jgi:5-deoxy-glucuronate isomerase